MYSVILVDPVYALSNKSLKAVLILIVQDMAVTSEQWRLVADNSCRSHSGRRTITHIEHQLLWLWWFHITAAFIFSQTERRRPCRFCRRPSLLLVEAQGLIFKP
jgi:hypothetical protein